MYVRGVWAISVSNKDLNMHFRIWGIIIVLSYYFHIVRGYEILNINQLHCTTLFLLVFETPIIDNNSYNKNQQGLHCNSDDLQEEDLQEHLAYHASPSAVAKQPFTPMILLISSKKTTHYQTSRIIGISFLQLTGNMKTTMAMLSRSRRLHLNSGVSGFLIGCFG